MAAGAVKAAMAIEYSVFLCFPTAENTRDILIMVIIGVIIIIRIRDHWEEKIFGFGRPRTERRKRLRYIISRRNKIKTAIKYIIYYTLLFRLPPPTSANSIIYVYREPNLFQTFNQLLNSFARQSFITPACSPTSTSRMTIIYTRGATDELFKTARRCSVPHHRRTTIYLRVFDFMPFEKLLTPNSDTNYHCRCKVFDQPMITIHSGAGLLPSASYSPNDNCLDSWPNVPCAARFY